MPRVIAHLGADAFFAPVEQTVDPGLRGKPMSFGVKHQTRPALAQTATPPTLSG
jgi:nucleotidyltransferase/DNA polymerase involved in DNA repair